MIIISQDRTVIINFDNIHLITKNDDSPYIFARTSVAEVMLGKYKTDQRALEVLNSLSDAISNNISNNIIFNKKIYIMPEK